MWTWQLSGVTIWPITVTVCVCVARFQHWFPQLSYTACCVWQCYFCVTCPPRLARHSRLNLMGIVVFERKFHWMCKDHCIHSVFFSIHYVGGFQATRFWGTLYVSQIPPVDNTIQSERCAAPVRNIRISQHSALVDVLELSQAREWGWTCTTFLPVKNTGARWKDRIVHQPLLVVFPQCWLRHSIGSFCVVYMYSFSVCLVFVLVFFFPSLFFGSPFRQGMSVDLPRYLCILYFYSNYI